jgi:hypothetical protein
MELPKGHPSFIEISLAMSPNSGLGLLLLPDIGRSPIGTPSRLPKVLAALGLKRSGAQRPQPLERVSPDAPV